MSNPVDLKTQKYDRQLRLWATTGQQALEEANICLLNATPTGCEILKNLVLPGVGHVTIVDEQKVTKQDIHNNFFLDPDSTGQSKAKLAAELLQELNEDASVVHIERNPSDLIHNSPEFFDPFSMIVTVNMVHDDMLKLSTICNESSKILIAVKNKGLVGVFSIQSPEHTVIETHPDNATDLRLATPFQHLVDYVDTFNLDELDQTDHGQVPFVVVLLKYVDAWKKEDNSIQIPLSYQQKKELEKRIAAGKRTPDEENFDEAISNAWRLCSNDHISDEVRHIFEEPSCQSAHSDSPHFWILARAVRDFVENEGGGHLPLSGKLPDMKSDTLNYIGLQNVYREKALCDLEAVKKRVRGFLEGSEVSIPDETIEIFCKNASNVRVIQYRPLTENHVLAEKLVNWVKTDENICYLLAYYGADKFRSKYGHLPVSQVDFNPFKEEVQAYIESLGVSSADTQEVMSSEATDKAILNFIRFGDMETPNLAALIGGLAAQEAIKLITHQYIPINNTCVFNGITSTSSVFEI
ncbi:Nedd8 activating enzyme E1 subunit 1 [Mucor mucedo]|uniref:Nedd8 activating enzyme E1 subunit 1 n=1 Tax=Mucor mucedo TaxID=29922 RepID=UPI0022200C26|nr:Nedd8 activating enzyme E1 subunit 1 [Mucor mucedo]KAI7887818.1 Nedd8 activating enzyme E1 subunit 1 [Mucor mucedo]